MKKTTDGGLTWSTLTPTGYLVKRPVISFVPGTTSTWFDVASSPSNGSSRSVNDCASFVNVDTGSVQFLSVSFFDSNTGWAGSFNMSATDDGIYKWNPAVLTDVANPSEAKLDDIVIYPVPAVNSINIQFGKLDDENMTIKMYNSVGELVMSRQIKAISNDLQQIDVSDKGAGMYFINITSGSKSVTKKITVTK